MPGDARLQLDSAALSSGDSSQRRASVGAGLLAINRSLTLTAESPAARHGGAAQLFQVVMHNKQCMACNMGIHQNCNTLSAICETQQLQGCGIEALTERLLQSSLLCPLGPGLSGISHLQALH